MCVTFLWTSDVKVLSSFAWKSQTHFFIGYSELTYDNVIFLFEINKTNKNISIWHSASLWPVKIAFLLRKSKINIDSIIPYITSMSYSSMQVLTKNIYNSEKINPFLANVPILHPLKTPENERFSDVFRGYKLGTLATNGLIQEPVF